MRTLLICAGLLCGTGAVRAEQGYWLNAADLNHAIQVPTGWPFPGFNFSMTPPGMTHLFSLAPNSRVLGIDVALEKAPGRDALPVKDYFDLARQVARNPPAQTIRLSDKSAFQYFKSVESKPGRKDYFVQGILKKDVETYYITINSPHHPLNPRDWKTALKALASLRTGSYSPLGKKVEMKGKTQIHVNLTSNPPSQNGPAPAPTAQPQEHPIPLLR